MMSATATPTLPISGAIDQRWIVRLLPSLTDFAFLLPALLLVWLFPDRLNTLLADGDTGWHIRTGEWILQHGAVPHQDFFSFTHSGQPWFAWEWGWDVVFALVHQTTGLAGVVFVNLLLLCAVSGLLFRSVRDACENDLLAFAVTTAGVGASVVHWLARPHLLSWVFFLLLLRALRSAEAGRYSQLRWLPGLVLVWTNVHGSFFLAIFMVVISAAGKCLEAIESGDANARAIWLRSRPFWLCAALCSAATTVNPYTWHVHAHILRYLSDSAMMDAIQEFQSISFHHGSGIIFGWLLLPGVAAILWCFQQRRWSACLALIAWTHFGLISTRNVPLFAFVACPLIAVMLQDTLGPWFTRAWPECTYAFQEAQHQLLHFERVHRWHFVSALIIGYVALCLWSQQPQFAIHFLPSHFPVAAVPVIQQAHAKRVFATDQWSDYLIYELYPATQVFVDGRSDLFGIPFLDRSEHILNARWDWEEDLRRFSVDMVIVGPDVPIATLLKHSSRWRVLFDNGSVLVFSLQTHSAQATVVADSYTIFNRLQDGRNRLGAVQGLQVQNL